MKYFDKDPALVPLNPEKVHESAYYRARQAMDWEGNQCPSGSFAANWLSLVRSTYQRAQRIHPKSEKKRNTFLKNVYPYGQSIYRHPSRFLRWYLYRNNGLLIGDPTGSYFVPINTSDTHLEHVPHANPNALADNFTLTLVGYYLKPPVVRITRKDLGYGFVKMKVPPYVTLSIVERHKWEKNRATQISGYLDGEIIKEFIRSEIGIYIRQFESSMDYRYVIFLKQTVGIPI